MISPLAALCFLTISISEYEALPIAAVKPAALEAYVTHTLQNFDEFQQLKSLGEKFGLRVWLMGGAASATATYLKWDMLRKAGDNRFVQNYFQYQLSDLLSNRQDIDLVVTPTGSKPLSPDKIPEFETEARRLFAGRKLELRGLKERFGHFLPIEQDEDLKLQDSDSYSLGLFELTDPSKTESRFRDLRKMSANNSLFLDDIARGSLTYITTASHSSAPRFKAGKNPRIISGVRYLTKLTSTGSKLREQDILEIAAVVRDWKFEANADPYVFDWLKANAPKLFESAVDLEETWNLLERIGLRQKLILYFKERDSSLEYLFNREPLRRKFGKKDSPPPTPSPSVKNRELIHVTSRTALSSIMKHPFGQPNFFISRGDPKLEGKERALLGEGSYFWWEAENAPKDGSPQVSVELLPSAQVGLDYQVKEHPQYDQRVALFGGADNLRVIHRIRQKDLESLFNQFFELKLATFMEPQTKQQKAALQTLRSSLLMKLKSKTLSPLDISEMVTTATFQIAQVIPTEGIGRVILYQASTGNIKFIYDILGWLLEKEEPQLQFIKDQALIGLIHSGDLMNANQIFYKAWEENLLNSLSPELLEELFSKSESFQGVEHKFITTARDAADELMRTEPLKYSRTHLEQSEIGRRLGYSTEDCPESIRAVSSGPAPPNGLK